MYPIVLADKAVNDFTLLKKENSKLVVKLWDLILDIGKDPYKGLGKPEGLKNEFSGWWSRRIDQKHRLIYRIKNDQLEIASCYGHYGDK